MSCAHPDFEARVDVNRLEDIGAFSADVKINCKACGEAFVWRGVEAGLSSEGPRVSVSGTELRAPIVPESARLGPMAQYGFSIRVHQPQDVRTDG